MAAGAATAEGIVRLLYSDASEAVRTQATNHSTQELDLSEDPRQLQVMAYGGQIMAEDRFFERMISSSWNSSLSQQPETLQPIQPSQRLTA